EVFRVAGVGTAIFERPRPLSRHRRADPGRVVRYTLNCEEPDNVVISIFLQTPALTTLPVLIWSSMTRDTDPTIAAAASLILLFTVSVLALALWIMGRRTQRTKKGILL
ncbi:hypothetical protein QWY28_22790, partial [Nocardioides sp. SOB77]|nr:hypothetical protein [Nocardioides oceani]